MSDGLKTCRVCKANDSTPLVAGGVEYARCGNCGTLQKLMTREEYFAMEPGYDPGHFLADVSKAELRKFLRVDENKVALTKIAKKIGKSPEGLDFLDIGCGMGGNLTAANELGMKVVGYEPSRDHSHVTREIWKLPIVEEYFSSDKVGDQRFDIIILSEVIEHIYDPLPFLEDVVSVLKPGGVLKLNTPNANALIARLTGPRWPMLVPIDHVTLLTKQSFRYLTPKGCKMDVWTDEAPFSFASSMAAIAKAKIKGRQVNTPDKAPVAAPKLLTATSAKASAVRGALTVLSAPFYLGARLSDRALGLHATFIRES